MNDNTIYLFNASNILKRESFGLLSNKSGIYKITNLINGKIYIGSAISLYKRAYNHFISLRDQKHHSIKLQRAFNKYGIENFVFEIMCLIDKSSLLVATEQIYLNQYGAQEFIRKENKTFRTLTYNIKPTAGSCLGFKPSLSTRLKRSQSMKGKNVGKLGSVQKTRKPVIQLDLNNSIIAEFSSVFAAVKETGISGLRQVCLGKAASAGGFRWIYKNEPKAQRENSWNKAVVQLDLEGNFITMFSKLKEARLATYINPSSICRVCKKDGLKTAGGYQWMYKNEFEQVKNAA